MKAWDIVGYTYDADQYCPRHIVAQLTSNPGDAHHDSADIGDPEQHLDLLARLAGINRNDETSYDSGEFPKVIFSSQVESDDDTCGACHEPLIEGEPPDTCLNNVDGHWYVITYGRAPYTIHARDCETCAQDTTTEDVNAS